MDYLIKKPIIFFDGNCGVCNFFVQFVLKWDKKEFFYFAHLNSDFTKKVLSDLDSLDYFKKDSILLLDYNLNIWTYSTAVLKIFRELKFFSSFYFFILIPKFLRDTVYKIFAKNRHLFIKNKCTVLNKDVISRRFLDL